MGLIHASTCPYSDPVEGGKYIVTRSRGLIFTSIVGLVSVPLLFPGDSGATTAQLPPNDQTAAQHNVLFVNSTADQKIGNGSERAPFRTITQALQVAQSSSVIILATGTYSASSGEQFPLVLKPGVSIQGDAHSSSKVLIQGGGTFLSPTFARQDITILGANQASLTGVTVTNPNPRGYGLWIESTSPIVMNDTFTGNNHDGISITGKGAPTIRNNHFYQNGANGITIYGTSQPEIRDNVFERTGFGINIAQKAAPLLIGNRISQNRSGVVAQADTRPVLRSNVIEGNTEDGVVAIANSQPNLGTKQEPGGNLFRQNGRYDINNKASRQVIPAFGNQLAKARTIGRVDLAGLSSIASQAIPAPSIAQLALNSAPTVTKAIPLSQQQPAAAITSVEPVIIPVPLPASTSQAPITPSKAIPPQFSEGSNSAGANGSNGAAIPAPATPELVAPPPPQLGDGLGQRLPVLQPAQVMVSDLLPVPSTNIPIGNAHKGSSVPVIRENSFVTVDSQPPSIRSQPLPSIQATAASLHYRVVVEAASHSQQDLVKTLVPTAFRTSSRGRVLMQVGVFSDRANADEILQLLNGKGLTAKIERLR